MVKRAIYKYYYEMPRLPLLPRKNTLQRFGLQILQKGRAQTQTEKKIQGLDTGSCDSSNSCQRLCFSCLRVLARAQELV